MASVLSVAQTTVLIGVNPCLTESYLKKQSQCQNGQNSIKSVIVRIYGDFSGFLRFWVAKNKANMPAFGRKSAVINYFMVFIRVNSWLI